MSDSTERPDSQTEANPETTRTEGVSAGGIGRIQQGDAPQTLPEPTEDVPAETEAPANAPATIHPRDQPETIETLPNPEKEGTTIKIKDTEGSADPPKGWTPGGPERGM